MRNAAITEHPLHQLREEEEVRRATSLAVLVAMLVLALSPAAGATVHHIMSGECAAPAADGTVADLQDPPGLSGGSSADNFAQPLRATSAAGALEFTAFDESGVPIDAEGPASNGDNGDQHCQNPETNGHPDDSDDDV